MKKYVTVFIPTYNGEKYIASTLDSLINQNLPKNYKIEILVTDSGSQDNTLDILKNYKDYIRLIIIPNKDYGHGRTRQKAAEMAKGEFILYLTQDATPTDKNWVMRMIEPFFINDKIGCVYGRQIPRPNAVPIIKREIQTVFNQFGITNQIVIHRKGSLISPVNKDSGVCFFSDVNSAIRKDLSKTIPFRDIRYSEDQALAKDMFSHGYWIGYSPQGSVWHSNEYNIRQFYQRKFDEYIGLQESVGFKNYYSKKEILLGWIHPTIIDLLFIVSDKQYSLKSKLYWIILSPAYNIAGVLGKNNAHKFKSDTLKINQISLEAQNKKSK